MPFVGIRHTEFERVDGPLDPGWLPIGCTPAHLSPNTVAKHQNRERASEWDSVFVPSFDSRASGPREV
jgi:hypothetical protein